MANYRLTETMESRIHRKVYVRFGGEYPETQHRNMKLGVGYLAYVMNTVGNIFSGQVVGETAKTLSERFGKVLQKRQSISINRQDVSTSINTQMDACNKQILNRHFSVKLNRHMIFETLRL